MSLSRKRSFVEVMRDTEKDAWSLVDNPLSFVPRETPPIPPLPDLRKRISKESPF
jgi:hypothetical protein